MVSERIPSETTILAFRHLLEKHNLGEQIFQTVKAHLKVNSMAMTQGTTIDATLIEAPSSTSHRGRRPNVAESLERKGGEGS